MNPVEKQELEINKLIQELYTNVGEFQFNLIPYEMIEAFQSNQKYAGLYQLLEFLLRERVGCTPNSVPEVVTSYNIIKKFVEVCNLKINTFNMKECFEKLTVIHSNLDKELAEEKLESNYRQNLELLHNKVSTKLDIKLKYSENIQNSNIALIKRLEEVKTDKELFDKEFQKIEKENPRFPVNYFRFLAIRNRILNSDNIQNFIGLNEAIIKLFPKEEVIHPLLKKYRDLMILMYENQALIKLRLNKKYEYAKYEFIHIPYSDYSELYNHTVSANRLSFLADMIGEIDQFLEYISNMIKSKSILVNMYTLSNYIVLLSRKKSHLKVYKVFQDHKRAILYDLKKNGVINENIFSVISSILTAFININHVIKVKFFSHLRKKFLLTANTKGTLLMCKKLKTLIKYIKARNAYLTLIGHKPIQLATDKESRVVCSLLSLKHN